MGYPDFKHKKTQVGTLTQQQLEPWIGGMRLCAPGATFHGTGVTVQEMFRLITM